MVCFIATELHFFKNLQNEFLNIISSIKHVGKIILENNWKYKSGFKDFVSVRKEGATDWNPVVLWDEFGGRVETEIGEYLENIAFTFRSRYFICHYKIISF